jgi:hypothetical protein
MKKGYDFKIGQRVVHSAHGAGSVFMHSLDSDSEIYVEFDVVPKGWGDKILCVTPQCLTEEKDGEDL